MQQQQQLDLSSLAKRFGVVDYVVFATTLVIAAGIGVFFCCTGGKQKTTQEFLMANRNMNIVPVALSLLASFMSAIAILGMPAEIYTYGTMYCWMMVSYVFTMYFSAYVYIPVFYNLKVTSAFEYLGRRFNTAVQVVTCCCYILQMTMYLAIAMYAPSIALSSVTGINIWVSVISLGAVTTFYTAIGGMKAVLWTDTFQIIIMFSGMLAVIIKGTMDQGISTIWQNAYESGRLDLFDWRKALNPNPLERHTFWTLAIGGTVFWTSVYGVNQAQVQRALAVPSLRKAQGAFWLNIPGLFFIVIMGTCAGLTIYSHFKDCDPFRSGLITARDQLYPLYVMEVLGELTGLPGLIVAAVFSGALSTVSSGLNSLAAVTLSDIVRKVVKSELSDRRATLISKLIAVSYGLLAMVMTYVVSSFGMILQASTSLFGIVGGPIFGVFSLGMFIPWANSKGALAGLFTSLTATMWVGLGGLTSKRYVYKYPTSTDGCYVMNQTIYNSTISENMNTTSTTTQSVQDLLAESRSGLNGLYSLSYLWFGTFACMICLVVGTIVSAITGFNDPRTVDARLITPVFDKICCCLPKKWRLACHCGVPHPDLDNDSNGEADTGLHLKEQQL